MSDALPLVESLPSSLSALDAFNALSNLPNVIFFDSALRDPELGRYSFVAADPFEFLRISTGSADVLSKLSEVLSRYSCSTAPNLPPFQGGAAGLFAYSLGACFERLPQPRYDEFKMPELAIGLYDVVLAFDHVQNSGWLISQGFPAIEPTDRRRRAQARVAQFREWLSGVPRTNQSDLHADCLAPSELAPQFPVAGPIGLTSNFSASDYRSAVERAVEYIRAGDLFQVNLAQRLVYPAQEPTEELYRRLRQRNPATFSAYFNAGDFQIASASPERFLKLRRREVETRPIKGTRHRIPNTETDLFLGDELQESDKDRAENIMIVDLLRNDLSRVCSADSVRVSQLCGLEVYQFVQHLVSVVSGTLEPERTPLDLIRATFPGGSITGAPKVRAMEIIAELEPTARGAYCGSLGYLGFDGGMDLSILIRTVTSCRGWWQFPVGGGIVAQSHPLREYEETWHKASGIVRALRP